MAAHPDSAQPSLPPPDSILGFGCPLIPHHVRILTTKKMRAWSPFQEQSKETPHRDRLRMRFTWDDQKRQTNFRVHSVDFVDAVGVLFDQLRGKPPRSGGSQERGGEVARCRRARLCRVRIYSGVCCCSMYCRIMEIGAPPQLPAK